MGTPIDVKALVEMPEKHFEMRGDRPGVKRGQVPPITDRLQLVSVHRQILDLADRMACDYALVIKRANDLWMEAEGRKSPLTPEQQEVVDLAINRAFVTVIEALRSPFEKESERLHLLVRANGWVDQVRMNVRD